MRPFYYTLLVHNAYKFSSQAVWKKCSNVQAANARAAQAVKHDLSPVGAARVLEAFMRMEKAKLGGVYVSSLHYIYISKSFFFFFLFLLILSAMHEFWICIQSSSRYQ